MNGADDQGVALDGRPSVAASEPVAKVVSGYGADERHDKHGEKLKPARPHQLGRTSLLDDWG
jgi:hypothetical protein